jgi:rhodanese-related sulfurtransferase
VRSTTAAKIAAEAGYARYGLRGNGGDCRIGNYLGSFDDWLARYVRVKGRIDDSKGPVAKK